MPKSHTDKQMYFPLRSTEQLEPSVTRYCPIPTAAQVKTNKLFGIPLVSNLTGEELQDEAIDFYIKTAISEIEHSLDLYITPVKFYERYDYDRHSFSWNYNYLKLDHRPILEISKVELSFSNDAAVDGFVQFPLEFVHTMPQEGVMQLVPAFGTSLSGFLLSAFSGVQYHSLHHTGLNHFPGGVRIEYTAGFCHDKIPAIIAELIEIKAAMNILSLLGPVLFPNNSVSIGIDGTSQSTSGPGPNFFANRLQQLKDLEDKTMDAVQNYYHRKFQIDFI